MRIFGDQGQDWQDWRADLIPDRGGSLEADLCGFALDHVNWFDLADTWIQAVTEIAAYDA